MVAVCMADFCSNFAEKGSTEFDKTLEEVGWYTQDEHRLSDASKFPPFKYDSSLYEVVTIEP